jgi:hypothetical protein
MDFHHSGLVWSMRLTCFFVCHGSLDAKRVAIIIRHPMVVRHSIYAVQTGNCSSHHGVPCHGNAIGQSIRTSCSIDCSPPNISGLFCSSQPIQHRRSGVVRECGPRNDLHSTNDSSLEYCFGRAKRFPDFRIENSLPFTVNRCRKRGNDLVNTITDDENSTCLLRHVASNHLTESNKQIYRYQK